MTLTAATSPAEPFEVTLSTLAVEAQTQSSDEDYDTQQGSVSLGRRAVNRFNSFMFPVAMVAAWFTPTPVTSERRFQMSTITPIYRRPLSEQYDEWVYAPELVTPSQIEALNRILRLPSVPDLNLDYGEAD